MSTKNNVILSDVGQGRVHTDIDRQKQNTARTEDDLGLKLRNTRTKNAPIWDRRLSSLKVQGCQGTQKAIMPWCQ